MQHNVSSVSKFIYSKPFLKFDICYNWGTYSQFFVYNHRLITYTNRTLDVVFSRFRGISFTISEAEAQRSYAQSLFLFCNSTQYPRTSFGILPQGYCERKPINLEKTTSNVLSVLLIIYVNNHLLVVKQLDKQRNWLLYSNSNYLILITLQPDGVWPLTFEFDRVWGDLTLI